jgi:hypothetical protein
MLIIFGYSKYMMLALFTRILMSLYSQRCSPICLVLLEGMLPSAFFPRCLEGIWGDFFFISFVPNMFPSGSQWVLIKFPTCFTRVFPIAPRFNPLCFAQSPPLLTYISGPKGMAPHLSIESSILGSLHGFNFFFHDGPIKLAHSKKKKKKSWTCEGPPTN